MKKAIPLHGGNIYKEALDYGFKPDEILDFSANINPLGIPPNLKAHLLNCLDKCINYPDPESKELKKRIGEYTGLQISNICVGNGAIDILYLIFKVIKVKKVVIPAPTFNEYEKAARTSGTEVIYYERLEIEGYRLNCNELFSFALKNNAEAILICNPNNPTSTAENAEELIRLINKAAENNIKIIIDEAFIELTKNYSKLTVSAFTKEYNNLYVIRAFTKYFAIPGLRLGYCLSSSENISAIEAYQPSWPINTLAAEAGIVFEIDKEYISKTNEWLRVEPDYLYKALCQISQIKVFPPDTCFILCKLLSPGWNAEGLRNILLKEKMLIRNAENFTYLDDAYFRLAVKDRESNIKLVRALKNIDWR